MSGLISQNRFNNRDNQSLLREFLNTTKDFAELLKNPNDLNKILTDAIQISDSEQAKVDEARDILVKADTVRQQFSQREKEMTVREDQVKSDADENEKVKNENNENSIRLEKLARELKSRNDVVSSNEMTSDKRQKSLDDRSLDLDKRESMLNDRDKAITLRENNLKDRADRLRKETEGL